MANSLVFQTLNGLTLGALLFFVASGLTVVFGLMRILNLAHGALFLLGGYAGLALVIAALASGILGLALQQGFSRILMGTTFNQVLLTLGIAFILQNLILAVWGGVPRSVPPPALLQGSTQILGVTYPYYRLFLIGLAVVGGALLWGFWERSLLGALLRACVDDRDMASAMGIRVDLAFASVFAVGSSLAGLTGLLGAPILGLSIGLDAQILLLSVVVVVVGGVGSLSGAFVGSMLVGMLDTYGRALFPEMSYFTLFAPVIFILLLRPSGLFGRELVE
jgi:branched-chain amino acid transport system permease protein